MKTIDLELRHIDRALVALLETADAITVEAEAEAVRAEVERIAEAADAIARLSLPDPSRVEDYWRIAIDAAPPGFREVLEEWKESRDQLWAEAIRAQR